VEFFSTAPLAKLEGRTESLEIVSEVIVYQNKQH
jgi:hypothetical protein